MRRLLAGLLLVALLVGGAPALAPADSMEFRTAEISLGGSHGLDNASQITFTAWLYLDNITQRTFISTTGAYGFLHDPAFSTSFYLSINGCGACATTSEAWPVATWAHVAFRWDGTAAAGSRTTFFKNGNPMASPADSNGTTSGTSTAALGFGAPAVSRLAGRMYNVKIWTRALSDDAIKMEMLCFRPQTSAPKVWLPMDKSFVDYSRTIVNNTVTMTGFVVPIADTPPVQACGG